MKPFVKHIILITILVALYFATDFLEKGIILNNITPYPIVGIVFWLLLLYIVWEVVLQPIIQFRKLKSRREFNITSEAIRIHKQLDAFKTKDIKKYWQSDIWEKLNYELTKNIEKKSNEYTEREKRLVTIIDSYINHCNKDNNKTSDAQQIINKYSWSAALCVVFSRNSFLDGLLILFAQMKMTVELSKLYGYKPSPLFNSLCFGWIATNSIMTGLFAQAGSEVVGEVIVDSLSNGDIVEGSLTDSIFSKSSSLFLEGLTAASTVYVTGYVVLMKLQGVADINIKTLFNLRQQGRLELIKSVPKNAFKALSAKFPEFSQWLLSLKNNIVKQN